MERVLLVTIKLYSEKDNWDVEDLAQELEELTDTCGAEVIDNVICYCDKPTPNLFIGSGKAEEIALLCQEENIDTVIFSHDLSGTQQRNLENVVAKKTIDRTQLILDIFALHAKTPEGKMQVELAQLQYLLPRLTGKGVVLSRMGGGIGTRGPGEQKLEVDRRRIRKRIDKLKTDLNHTSLHRATTRKKRKDNAVPTIALVGYTNAGKSTLLNNLTEAGQVVADSLFTTLDPLSKQLKLPNGETAVLSDTVGFLHNLPHHLIESFKATLEEVIEADLLIHVLDISHPRVYEYFSSVNQVLKQLGADKKKIITVLNKIDLIATETESNWLSKISADFPDPVAISASLKTNFDQLLSKIAENFLPRMARIEILIPHSKMEVVDLVHRAGKVEKIGYLPDGVKIEVNLPKIFIDKYLKNIEIKHIS